MCSRRAVTPVTKEEWAASGVMGRACLVIGAPVRLILTLLIPVVNNAAVNNGWNRVLCCVHCFTSPFCFVYCWGIYKIELTENFGIWALLIITSLALASIVLATSENFVPPRYHIAFAFLGFFVAFSFLYRMAQELTNLLSVIGIVLRISRGTLGMTILAWGNSVGDLVANTALVRAGYPMMGFSACFGGPLMSLAMGVTMCFSRGLVQEGSHEFKTGPECQNCVFFLISGLVSTILAITIYKFECRSPYGVYLIVLYFMFIVFAFTCEFEITYSIHY